MKKPAGIAAILSLIVAVSLLAASDVQAGAALAAPITKTTGGSLTATIVTDVTGGQFALGKGTTSIRVQKAGVITAAVFTSTYVASFQNGCIAGPGFSLTTSTSNRFTGMIDGLIDTSAVLTALFSPFGIPSKAVIIDQDYVACTTVNGREILSFTAVVQFEQ
jgi:hypothetical protein